MKNYSITYEVSTYCWFNFTGERYLSVCTVHLLHLVGTKTKINTSYTLRSTRRKRCQIIST